MKIRMNSVDPFLDLGETLDIDLIVFLNFNAAIYSRLKIILALATLKA